MIPVDLLDRLREADPELLKEFSGDAWVWVDVLPEFKQFYINSILQSTLQEAIRARGWHLLQSQDPDTGKFYAEISTIGPGYDGDYYNEKHISLICQAGEGDTEAEALLRAYLAAIISGKVEGNELQLDHEKCEIYRDHQERNFYAESCNKEQKDKTELEHLREENRKLREAVIKERAYGNAQYDGIDLYWDTPQETEDEYRKRAESELRSEGVIP